MYGTQYDVGTGADTLCQCHCLCVQSLEPITSSCTDPASGGADDWAKTSAGVKYSFLVELRPTDNVWDGFMLDEREIVPTATETFAGLQSVARNVIEEFSNRAPRGTAPPTAACCWSSSASWSACR